MNDDQIDKLYAYLQKEFAQVRTEVKASSQRVDKVYDIVDGIAKSLEDDQHERVALTSQVDRHETWIQQIARHLGIKLASNR